VRGYTAHVRLYLAPYLGQILLAELSAAHVQAMFTAIIRQHQALGSPVSAATLNRIRATLRAARNAAIRRGLITGNPASRAELPRARRPRAVVWTPSRVEHWQRTGERPPGRGLDRRPDRAVPTRDRRSSAVCRLSWLCRRRHKHDLRHGAATLALAAGVDLLLKLALLDRAADDPAGLLCSQREILEPIARAIEARSAECAGFDATLLAWRRTTAQAALDFLDAITAAGPRRA
jgi:hypothetical protein